MYISVILNKPSLFDKVEKYICTIYTIACTWYVINEEEEMKKKTYKEEQFNGLNLKNTCV